MDSILSAQPSRIKLLKIILVGTLLIIYASGTFTFMRKVSAGRTAYHRWRPMAVALAQGRDVYKENRFPYPPVAGLLMNATARMPKLVGGAFWQLLKGVSLAAIFYCAVGLVGMRNDVRGPVLALIGVVLTGRYLVSDLTHGNINLFVAALTMLALYAFRGGKDVWAGLALGLAISLKVTPGLFVMYFLWKRQWAIVGWTATGLVLFLLLVPSVFVGPTHNIDLLHSWSNLMITPFVEGGLVTTEHINQSVPGMIHRMLTDGVAIKAVVKDGVVVKPAVAVNLVSLPISVVKWVNIAASLLILCLLGFFTRGKVGQRDSWQLALEHGLVMVAMLMLSERSWKAHHVVLVLPVVALAAALCRRGLSPQRRNQIIVLMVFSAVMACATTSGLIGKTASKYCQAYSCILLGSIALFWALLLAIGSGRHNHTYDN